MSFEKWPRAMVLPEAEDFEHGEWESRCGTRGCAVGWLCTAFGVRLPPYEELYDPHSLPVVPVASPAAEFAEALMRHLPKPRWKPSPMGLRACNPVVAELSDAFEGGVSSKEMAEAWEAAAREKGYVPNGRFR